MMRKLITIGGLVFLTAAMFVMVGGCPQDGTDNTGGTDNTSLTAAEKDALVTGSQSCQSLGNAAGVTKSSAQDDNSSFDVPSIPNNATTYTFGNCPEVTMSVDNLSSLTFELDVDFGNGCSPYVTQEDYDCTGSASGTFSQAAKNINLTFNEISCGYATLDGGVDVNYDVSGQVITLDGAWDLDYEDDIGPIQTDGEGTASYDAENLITTFSIFNGTITDTQVTWTMGLSGIKMSYPTYGNYIPYAGEATVSGTEIRTFKVKFDEDSPTTGIVQVSIAGGAYFDVDLYALSGS